MNASEHRLPQRALVLPLWVVMPAVGRRSVLIVVMMCVGILASCSTSSSLPLGGDGSGVAVIGVVAKTGLGTAFNKNRVASEFATTLAGRGKFPVLRADSLRQVIGAKRHDQLLKRYADRGSLAQQDVQLLMAAGLPTRHAIILRVEEDLVTKLPVRREAIRNRQGAVLVDREKRILSTQRITTLSAKVINLRNGDERWNQQFRVDPSESLSVTEYLGSSFTGSLAAAFANTLVNGVRIARYPDAPPFRLSLQSLLGEVARSLPIR